MNPAPATQQTVRRHNRAIVLWQIAAHPGRSRAQVAEATGMSRATVSTVVDELVRSGLVREREAGRGVRGRPAVPLVLDEDGPAALGVEINVDYISVCVMDLTGRVRAQRIAVSGNRDARPARVLRRAADLAGAAARESGLSLAGATLALPGLIGQDGRVLRLPNLPRWEDADGVGRLAARLGVPARVDNEANLAALAEARAGRHGRDFVLVSGEIGVGAGIVVGGALYRGVNGFAGEFGHTVVDPAGPVCGCGARGCLETFVGQEALLRSAGLLGTAGTWTASPEGPAARLVEAAERGDRRTTAALREAGRLLGVQLATALNLLDVPTVVLGGLYARLAPWLTDPITEELTARLLSRATVTPVVAASSLGSDAAVVGAAGSVVDQIIADGGVQLGATAATFSRSALG